MRIAVDSRLFAAGWVFGCEKLTLAFPPRRLPRTRPPLTSAHASPGRATYTSHAIRRDVRRVAVTLVAQRSAGQAALPPAAFFMRHRASRTLRLTSL